MTTRNALQNFIVGEAIAVDVAAVERELTGLWKSAAESPDSEAAVMRACVLNLLACAENEKASEWMNSVIRDVTDYHPCRAIVLVRRESGDPHAVEARVSAHCRLPVAGGKQVCGEQISLAAGKAAFSELHGTVLPLLVTDLPVFLWWPGRLDFSDHLLQTLLPSCERLLVDSAGLLQTGRNLVALARLVAGQGEHTAVVDLAWTRTALWRGLAAQFYDTPDFRPAPTLLGSAEIDYAADSEPDPTQALLLCGWLISRLRWKLGKVSTDGSGVYDIDCLRSHERIQLHVQPTRNSAAAQANGELLSVRLVTRPAPGLRFSIARGNETAAIVTQVSKGESILQHRVAYVPSPVDAQLLCEELEVVGHDRAFEEALQVAATILETGG